MSILFNITLFTYLGVLSLFMSYFGLMWNKYENKLKRNPKILLVLLYSVNFLILNYLFQLPLIPHFICDVLLILAVFFGTRT